MIGRKAVQGMVVLAALALSTSPVIAQHAGGAHAPVSGFFTTSDGVKLHYLEAGHGPALVFVPGWTMPADIWEHQIAHFARTHRVIALDPRSQGKSEKPYEGHYPERRARDVLELIEQLGLAPATVVGWSLAVPELLTLVQEHGTGSLRALVLVDGFVGADEDSCAPNPLLPMLKAMHQDRRGHANAFIRSMYRTPQSDAYLKRITQASLETPTTTAFTLLAHLMTTSGDWRPALERVDRPLLYVASGQMRPQAEMVVGRVRGARMEVFENAGHALFVDEAPRFNRVLEEFLAALK